MTYITTVTVTNDNDPSCKTYVLSESFRSSTPPDPQTIKDGTQMVIDRFRKSHPQNHSLPAFPPVVVEIKQEDD